MSRAQSHASSAPGHGAAGAPSPSPSPSPPPAAAAPGPGPGGSSLLWARSPCAYVVAFYDAFVNANDGTLAFVMEYMDGGSLEDIVSTGGVQRESVLANICVQVLKGLQFLHRNHIVHRDLKPSNLLINHAGDVKLTDFGIVRQLDGTLDMASTFVGTATYMAPERIAGEPYSYHSDVWSFGLSILAVALGRYPIDVPGGASYWSLLNYLQEEEAPLPPADRFSPAFRDFIAQCLQKDPGASDRLLAQASPFAARLAPQSFARCLLAGTHAHSLTRCLIPLLLLTLLRLQKGARCPQRCWSTRSWPVPRRSWRRSSMSVKLPGLQASRMRPHRRAVADQVVAVAGQQQQSHRRLPRKRRLPR